MGLTSALNTSLTGLSLNETLIDVIGNNISNAGTTGFKASTVTFATQLANTLNAGSSPSGTDGGTNPVQIGLGAQTASVSADFSQGSLSTTNNASDLAIQGNGFFIVGNSDPNSQAELFSRDGHFQLDSSNQLANSSGLVVRGYGVDATHNLVTTSLVPLTIPLGEQQVAQQTSKVSLTGALSPQGTVGTQGTTQTSDALTDVSTGNAISTGTLLTNVRDGSTVVFPTTGQVGFTPTIAGQTTGTETIDNSAGSKTVGDLLTLIQDNLGLQAGGSPAVPPDAADHIPAGATITPSGQIQIKGNRGTINDFDMPTGSLTVNGVAVTLPFTAGPNRANGESTQTSFLVYDSLGSAVTVKVSAVLESQTTNLTTYRYFLDSPDQGSGNSNTIGTGVLKFNNIGQIIDPTPVQFSIKRTGTSATDPMTFNLDLSGITGVTSTNSTLNLGSQDGAAAGTLTGYAIDQNGTINGSYDNGLTRTLGQVVLARFANPAGLLQQGQNTFVEGSNSGAPQKGTAGTLGLGKISAGTLELSNTDIGKSLVDLITASTNYQGNARVITVVNQLVTELMQLGR